MATLKTYHVADADPWAASQTVTFKDRRVTASGQFIEVVAPGITGNTEPDFIAQESVILDDGTAQWKFCCVRDYAVLPDLTADIGTGLSNTLVTDDETWEVLIWRHGSGSAYQHTANPKFEFSEACDIDHRVIVKPAPGESWVDNTRIGTDPIRYDPSRGVAFEMSVWVEGIQFSTNTQFCECHSLQIKTNHTHANAFVGGTARGCIGHLGSMAASSRYAFSFVGLAENCFGFSEQTADNGRIFNLSYGIGATNCTAIWCGTGSAPTGFTGFQIGHPVTPVRNCVAINCDSGFGGGTVTSSSRTGNVSDDATASLVFPTQGDIINNGTGLATNTADPSTVDATPLPNSSAFAVNTSETDHSNTPTTDVFGFARTIGSANYRGAINSLTPGGPALQRTVHIADAAPWIAAEALSIRDRRITSSGQLIEVTTAGTTGSDEPDFQGRETLIRADGSVSWKFCCHRQYDHPASFLNDIGNGLTDTLVTGNENWTVLIWHDRRGPYTYSNYVDAKLEFAENCSVDHKVIIRPAPGDSLWDALDRTVDPVRYDPSKGAAIRLTYSGNSLAFDIRPSGTYCEIHDLQIEQAVANATGLRSEASNSLINGVLCHANPTCTATSYSGQRGKIQNCIAMSEQTATTGLSLFSFGWSANVSNCMAVFAGAAAPTGLKGFNIGHADSTYMNNVAINCDTGFSGAVPTGSNSGNISSDGSAAIQFSGGIDTISNATDLIMGHASAATANCQPLEGSSIFTDNTSEMDFSNTPSSDVFGHPRASNAGDAFRGPICSTGKESFQLQHRYANFDLGTGDNDGTSEANAWQTYADMKAGAAAGQHIHIKRTASPTVLPVAEEWYYASSEDKPFIIQGYETTPGDNGFANFTGGNGSFWRINGRATRLLNLEVTSNYGSYFLHLNGADSFISNCKITNTVGGALTTGESTIINCYLEGYGFQGRPVLYIGRTTLNGNMIVQKGAAATGIYATANYRQNYISNNLIYCTASNSTGDGIYLRGDTTNSRNNITGNTIDGFSNGFRVDLLRSVNGAAPLILAENLFSNCVTGIQNDNAASQDGLLQSFYNAFYNCATPAAIGTVFQHYPIILPADPYMGRSIQDFTLNNAASGGSLIKGKLPIGADGTTHQSHGAVQEI
ncbi:MAG: right-handed parallel beta-helix repeat-containing protein [Sneathiella sp.]